MTIAHNTERKACCPTDFNLITGIKAMSETQKHAEATSHLTQELGRKAEEELIFERLEMLRRDYERAAKPYIDRLCAIRAMEMPKPMIITPEQLMALNNIKLDKGAIEL